MTGRFAKRERKEEETLFKIRAALVTDSDPLTQVVSQGS